MLSFFRKIIAILARQPKETQPTSAPPQKPVDKTHPAPNAKSKVSCAIIVGHSKKDKGAVMTDGTAEYDYNTEILSLIQSFKSPIKFVGYFRDGRDIVSTRNAAQECDMAIELHFNSFNRVATGTETLCSSDKVDKEFAKLVHENVLQAFGRNVQSRAENRGLKILSKGERGATNVLNYDGPNCLLEPFFGDNAKETKLANEKKSEYALAIIKSAEQWAARQGFKL